MITNVLPPFLWFTVYSRKTRTTTRCGPDGRYGMRPSCSFKTPFIMLGYLDYDIRLFDSTAFGVFHHPLCSTCRGLSNKESVASSVQKLWREKLWRAGSQNGPGLTNMQIRSRSQRVQFPLRGGQQC